MKALIDYFIPHVNEGICMAFSGGVDSSVLLAAACRAAKVPGFTRRVTPPRLRPSPVHWAPCTVLSKLMSSLTAVF